MRFRIPTALIAAGVLAAVALAPVARAGDSEGSTGLKEGDRCRPFDVFDITGPKKGSRLCYV